MIKKKHSLDKMLLKILLISCVAASLVHQATADVYDNTRCICTCPYPSVVNGTNRSNRLIYKGNVPPNKCNCDGVVLPQLGDDLKGKEQEFCPRCQCKYENRNTFIIKMSISLVMWLLSLLIIYMLFLMCLEPLLNKRVKGNYQEHTNEEEDAGPSPITSTPAVAVTSNVLGIVGHQQDKWKKQVQEQRKNIYDRHTMLN